MSKVSIQLKILLSISLFLIIMTVISVVLSTTNQRNSLLDTIKRSIERNDHFLTAVISKLMVEGNADLVSSTLSELQDLPEIDSLQIYRPDGKAAFSDYATIDAVNNAQNGIEFSYTSRQAPYFDESPLFRRAVESGLPQIEENIEERRLEFFFPLLNTADCRVCHGDDNDIRGIIYYQVSLEGMFNQINNGRTWLLLFLLISCLVVVIVLFILTQQVVVHPLQSLSKVLQDLGRGNLEAKAELSGNDELSNFSDQLNNTVSNLRETIRKNLEERTIEITQKENKKYLNVVSEGILFIGTDRKITSLYSASLAELFETKDIAGKTLAEFLYPDEPTDATLHVEIQEFIDVIFENLNSGKEVITSINPLLEKEFFIDGEDGQKRIIIDCTFYPIVEDNKVVTVMVSFADRTAIIESQEELEEQRQNSGLELSLIATILKIDEESFSEFISSSKAVVQELSVPKANNDALVANLDSIKVTAQALNLSQIGEIVHNIDHELSINPESLLLKKMAAELVNAVKNLAQIRQHFRSTASPASRSPSTLVEFRNTVEKVATKLSADLKKMVNIVIRGNIQRLPMLPHLHKTILHLIRNAFEHGIEDGQERITAGKDESGKIELLFLKQDEGYKIIVADDGRGIDFAVVEQQARNLGHIEGAATRDELIKLLFSPGFSTKDIPKSGIGLSDVQKAVQSLGGKISVYTEEGSGSHFTIIIPETD